MFDFYKQICGTCADQRGWQQHDCGPSSTTRPEVHLRELAVARAETVEANQVVQALGSKLTEVRNRLEVAHRQEERLGDHNTALNRRVHLLEERLIAAGNKVTEMKAAIASRQSPPSEHEVQDALDNLRLSGYHDEAEVLLTTWRALSQALEDIESEERPTISWRKERATGDAK